MANPELGTKRTCVSCAAKFFDLTKQPAVCPKCGTEQPAEPPRLKRTGGNIAEEKRRAKPAPVPGLDSDSDVEVEAAEEEEEEGVLEDTSDLDDDAEEIAVEVETEGSEEER